MFAQHRVIGTIPGVGHGNPLQSSAFPLNSALTTTTAYRKPVASDLPAQAVRISEDGIYQILLSTFEIHATHFGQFALISTNEFRAAHTQNRPWYYMNTVAMTDEAGNPLPYLPVEDLLTFSGFIPPAQFATLNAGSRRLDCTLWQPAPAPERKAFFAPGTAAHRALLGKYWAAASSRLFGGNAQTISVCLGNHTQCLPLIEDAKALLLCDILKYLPPAVSNIASMTAGTVESTTHNVFKDSALVVVFPTGAAENPPTFDLRRQNGYPALSPIEDQFIESLLNNGHSSFMRDIISRNGSSDESQLSFAADYDFALLLYQLERSIDHAQSVLSPAVCMTAWKQLNTYLIQRHGFTLEQVNKVLAGVERRLLPFVLSSREAISSVDQYMLPALWEKALTVKDESLSQQFSALISLSPAAGFFPKMIESFPSPGEIQVNRIANLIKQIRDNHYANNPITDETAAQLNSDGLLTIARKYLPIREALSSLLEHINKRYRDHALTILPLSCQLLNGKSALQDVVLLLKNNHVSQLPEKLHIDLISAAYSRFADQDICKAFCSYFADCLPKQLNCLDKLSDMMLAIMPDHVDNALIAVLNAAAADQSKILLNAEQTNLLLGNLLPRCSDPVRVGQAYVNYEQNRSSSAHEPPRDRMERLCACINVFKPEQIDMTQTVCSILKSVATSDPCLQKSQLDRFFARLLPYCRNRRDIRKQFFDYIDKSVHECHLKGDDCFRWLCDMQELYSRLQLLNQAEPYAVICKIASYLKSSYEKRSEPLNQFAHDWLTRLASHQPDAFSSVENDILSLYDTLLKNNSCRQEAERQLIPLLPSFTSTADYPDVRKLDQQDICNRFCKMLDEKGLDSALKDISSDMRRCALSEDELLNRTQDNVCAALEKQFDPLERGVPEAFKAAYICDNDSAKKTQLHNQVLAKVYKVYYGRRMKEEPTLNDVKRLNAVADALRVERNDLPKLVEDLEAIISNPGASAFITCLDKIKESGLKLDLITKALTDVLPNKIPTYPYPQSVYAAMLCSLRNPENSIDWNKALKLLGFPTPQKLPKPYCAEWQLWLAVIHAICEALSPLPKQHNCNFDEDFLSFLDHNFKKFSDAAYKKEDFYFPPKAKEKYNNLLKKWLNR